MDAKAKVLVVDDERGILEVCRRILAGGGHDVEVVSSGEEALSRLRDGWDLILADLNLPCGVTGIDLLNEARRATSADVIIMTGLPDLGSVIAAIRAGAYDYLLKPFSADSVLVAVNRCLEKRRLSHELQQEKALRIQLDQANAELESMARLRETFGRFVTPEVARFVLETPQALWRKGERRPVSVMFADVRRFTRYSESVPPEEAVEALNEIFEGVVKAVNDERGMTNKFLGDGLFAIFGAPVDDEHHALHAVRAALRARTFVDAWSARRERLGRAPLRVGIGVNTGEVVAGCLGGEDRAEYSVIGRAVNLASRLVDESAAGQILVGPETAAQIGDHFNFGMRIPLALAGITHSVLATEILDEKD